MPNTDEVQWYTVCYGDGLFVAVSYHQTVCAFSSDGINWTEGVIGNDSGWYVVCYGGNKFVATTAKTEYKFCAYCYASLQAVVENHTHETSSITDFQQAIIDLIYPVGSIYISMNDTSPQEKFGGTWEQIVDRFLYCASSSGVTGGSTEITIQNLPKHTHTFSGEHMEGEDNYVNLRGVNGTDQIVSSNNCEGVFHLVKNDSSSGTWTNTLTATSDSGYGDTIQFEYTPSGLISETGNGSEYMPPYMTVYCWQRTA